MRKIIVLEYISLDGVNKLDKVLSNIKQKKDVK